jgi:hypothetical protein
MCVLERLGLLLKRPDLRRLEALDFRRSWSSSAGRRSRETGFRSEDFDGRENESRPPDLNDPPNASAEKVAALGRQPIDRFPVEERGRPKAFAWWALLSDDRADEACPGEGVTIGVARGTGKVNRRE